MILVLTIGMFILSCVMYFMGSCSYKYDEVFNVIGTIAIVIFVILFIFGSFHGFINYLPTEGTHQGIVTAVE